MAAVSKEATDSLLATRSFRAPMAGLVKESSSINFKRP